MKRLLVVLAVAFASLVTAAVAFAQNPTEGGYGGVGGGPQGEVAGGGAGALPFTGLDLVLLIGAGALLLAAGLTLRRMSRAKS